MKQVQKLSAITLLTCILSIQAFAGVMDAPIAPPPPPDGEMHYNSSKEHSEGAMNVDPLLQIALNIVQSMLSLF
ncbi:MAG TPA: hypothetical protein VF666_06275 [Pyrinomonadaceae bacterium]